MKKLVDNGEDRKIAKRLKVCYAKWDKPLAAIVGLVCFSGIMSLLIFKVYDTPEDVPKLHTPDILIRSKSSKSERRCQIRNLTTCKVECNNIPMTIDVEEEIKAILPSSGSCGKISLEIIGMDLEGYKIPEKWLNGLGVTVNDLTITSSSINAIEDGAFSSNYLNKISELVLKNNNNLNHFGKGMFEGMILLSYFSLQYYSLTNLEIENDFLQFADGLETLQLTYCYLTSDTIRNITNSNVHLPKLVKIDFGYSKIDSLKADVFRRVPSLISLYLTSTTLKSLELGVFNNLMNLKLLTLQGNSLITLPEGIFDGISFTTLTLHDNPWRCDCDLKWLQDIYLNLPENEYPSPTCSDHSNATFEDVTFCSTEQSESDTTTTSPITDIPTPTMSTETIPSPPKRNSKTVYCTNHLEQENVPSERDLVASQALTIHEEIFTFDFYETVDSPLKIEVEVETTANLEYYHMLWFNTYHPTEEGCIAHLKSKMIIDDMKTNASYTICILYNTEVTVPPHDCFGFKVRAEYSERAWIKNKARNIVIILVTCLILAVVIISACFMYWCVRCHPRLIKGNNRVIIIEKQKPRPESVGPVVPEYERPAYVAPSVDSYMTAQASYITTSIGYERINTRNKRPMLSSQQDISKLAHDVFKTKAAIEDNTSIYEPIPPPLPPPNQPQKGNISLEIIRMDLEGYKIPEKWLNGLGVSVNDLAITSSSINAIEDGAFSGNYLNKISKLILKDNKDLNHFGKGMFEGMTLLSYFSLQYYFITNLVIENDFFQFVDGLQMLQLTYCYLTSDTIRHITNSNVYLPRLTLIDFSFSKIDSLEANVFRQAPNLKMLYLSGTALKSLELGVFNNLMNLEGLTLQDNNLITLPEGIFNDISFKTLTFYNNPWRCDCDLKWLQHIYLNLPDNERYPPPRCHDHSNAVFEDVDFCPSTTTFPISTTSMSTETTPQTTLNRNSKTLYFMEHLEQKNLPSETDLVASQTLTIHEEIFNLDIYEAVDSPIKIEVEINTTANLEYYHMLWFNTYHPTEEGCISHLKSKIIIDDMKSNVTYTICILYNTEVTVPPHDCFGFKVRAEYPERAWIKNKERNIIIILITCLILAVIIISVCVMYWCVRCNPRLIKGNNRVIIIEKQKPKPESVGPVVPEYERPAYVSPSVDSYMSAQASYITTSIGYERINTRNRRQPFDTIHEEIVSNGNNLMSSQQDISKLAHDIFITKPAVEDNTSIYEPIPPPLPPPNQPQKVTISTAEHNLYTTA